MLTKGLDVSHLNANKHCLMFKRDSNRWSAYGSRELLIDSDFVVILHLQVRMDRDSNTCISKYFPINQLGFFNILP